MIRNNSLNSRVCSICGESDELNVIYSGPIRSGGIGSDFIEGHRVIHCSKCDFVFLNRCPDNIEEFYETNIYRENFDYQIDIYSMREKFDPDQHGRINRIGIENIRNKVIADFGAGPGIFIDAIKSIAKSTIVIEPSQKYRDYLSNCGHLCFPYAEKLLESHSEIIDVAVSFDTIEHIPDVKKFAADIYHSLKPGGSLYLSMPNLDDVVRFICPTQYEPFYFQVAHVNYFNKNSSLRLLVDAGFSSVNIDYIHKYKIDNIFQWIKSGAPGRFDSGNAFDRAFHAHFNAEIERLGIASHLFIVAKK